MTGFPALGLLILGLLVIIAGLILLRMAMIRRSTPDRRLAYSPAHRRHRS